MKKIQFSIIVPVYNAEAYLDRCLDSLECQGLSNYEVLLINDGSTDHSLEICKSYQHRNSVFKIIEQSNQGVCAARNNGILHAQGEWIIFVDADDYLLDNGLSTAFYAVKNTEQFDVIQYKSSYDFWPKHPLTKDVLFQGDGFDLIKQTGFVSFCWLCFYRSSFLENHKLKFNNQYIVGEDQLFVASVFLCNPRTAVVSTDFYRYVVHENSATTKRDVNHTRRCVDDYLNSFNDILQKSKSICGQNGNEVFTACQKALNAKKMFGFSRILSSQYGYNDFHKVRKHAKEIEFIPFQPIGNDLKAKVMALIMNLVLEDYLFYKLASLMFNKIIVPYILPRLRMNL